MYCDKEQRTRSITAPLLQESDQETAVEDQRRKQAAAIEQLRHQLEELESYAYMSGDSAGPPSRLVLDRQRLVMEQLRDRYWSRFHNHGEGAY